jgi:hypothetical protein
MKKVFGSETLKIVLKKVLPLIANESDYYSFDPLHFAIKR